MQPRDEDGAQDDAQFFMFPSNGAPVEWNWQRKTEALGEKPVPVPIFPPQIPHGLTPGLNPGLRRGKLATNHLSYGTAQSKHLHPVSSLLPFMLRSRK
jgi:hypothetical protein